MGVVVGYRSQGLMGNGQEVVCSAVYFGWKYLACPGVKDQVVGGWAGERGREVHTCMVSLFLLWESSWRMCFELGDAEGANSRP